MKLLLLALLTQPILSAIQLDLFQYLPSGTGTGTCRHPTFVHGQNKVALACANGKTLKVWNSTNFESNNMDPYISVDLRINEVSGISEFAAVAANYPILAFVGASSNVVKLYVEVG